MKNLNLIFLLLLFFSVSKAQNNLTELFKKGEIKANKTKIVYRYFTPEIKEGKKYPLILALHGSGERGNDNISQIKYHKLATTWVERYYQIINPCFVLAPQCPKDKRWVQSEWDKIKFDIDKKEITNELKTVMELIDKFIKEYPIDENRIYITGLSMGGIATWYLIEKFPEKFAAAIPMSGFGDPSKVERIKNIPLWVFHGEKDDAVPVKGSRLMVEALNKIKLNAFYTDGFYGDCTGANYNLIVEHVKRKSDLIYTEYCNKKHVIWKESFENPLLHKWLFSHKKELSN